MNESFERIADHFTDASTRRPAASGAQSTMRSSLTGKESGGSFL